MVAARQTSAIAQKAMQDALAASAVRTTWLVSPRLMRAFEALT
jgi:hypothetical protein